MTHHQAPTSALSCLTVGGAALLITAASSSPWMLVLVDKSFLTTVFSNSLISSSNGISIWMTFIGTCCLHFCKKEKHIGIKLLYCLITVTISLIWEGGGIGFHLQRLSCTKSCCLLFSLSVSSSSGICHTDPFYLYLHTPHLESLTLHSCGHLLAHPRVAPFVTVTLEDLDVVFSENHGTRM